MKDNIKNAINKKLEKIAYELAGERGCRYFWGEVEVPECLKKEIENEEQE